MTDEVRTLYTLAQAVSCMLQHADPCITEEMRTL
jgi:hypothetical protein